MPSLSIMTITNVAHSLHEFAIKKTQQNVPWDEIVWISDREPTTLDKDRLRIIDIEKIEKIYFDNFEPEASVVPFNIGQYCYFCLNGFYNYVKTDFTLIVQNDSMAVDKRHWTDEYFEYDYIGPATHLSFAPVRGSLENKQDDDSGNKYKKYAKDLDWFNGGGGFSLRSRKLLDVLASDREIVNMLDYNCEDIAISVLAREYLEKKHKIKFAPIDVCLKFATELLILQDYYQQRSLGFHGWYNAPLCLSENECLYYFKELNSVNKSSFHLNGYEIHNLAMNCLRRNYYVLAKYLMSIKKWPYFILPIDISAKECSEFKSRSAMNVLNPHNIKAPKIW